MQIPLFPLHTVLAPGIALPLHIFEERYRVMVRRCLDRSTPFGIVLIRQGSEVAQRDGATRELSISGVGTFAEIREASTYLDGRWDLLTVGTGRFIVRDVIADLEPYLVGEVDELDDSLGDEEEAEALVGRVTRRFVDYLRLLQPRDGEEVEPIDVQVEVEVPDTEDAEDAPGAAGGDVRRGAAAPARRAAGPRAGAARQAPRAVPAGPAFAARGLELAPSVRARQSTASGDVAVLGAPEIAVDALRRSPALPDGPHDEALAAGAVAGGEDARDARHLVGVRVHVPARVQLAVERPRQHRLGAEEPEREEHEIRGDDL